MSKRQARSPFEVNLNWKVVFGIAEPEASGWARVRASQISDLLQTLPLIAAVNVANAASLAWLLWGLAVPPAGGLWLGLMMVVLLSAAAFRRAALPLLPLVRPGAMERASIHGFLLGLLWSAPPLFFADGVNDQQHAAIYLIAFAMTTSGALTASTIPQVALLYIGGSAIGLSVMVAQFGNPLLALLPPAYALGLIMCAFYNGRAFLRRKCAEIALEEKSEVVSLLLREFEENGADWLWQIDSAKQLTNVSTRLAHAAGCDPIDLEGTPLLQLFAGESWAGGELGDEVKDLFDRLQRRESFKDLVLPITVHGEPRWWCLSAAPRFGERGNFIGFRGVGSDQTEQRRSVERIDQMARLDSLTGLLNRREITSSLRDALARAYRERGRCALILIDLDRFKAVNDTLGHPVGDRLLKMVSERLRALLAPTDLGGRLGGDEFAIVAGDAIDTARVDALGAAIVAQLGEPFEIDHHVVRIGGSVGIAIGPRDGRTVETLLRHADVALYQAKKDGRGTCRRYEPKLLADLDRRRTIEAALRDALDHGQFILSYHPVIASCSGGCEGYEARLSWSGTNIPEVGIDELTSIAQEAQLMGRLGEWILRTACADAASWTAQRRLWLDVSREQLLDGQLAATLLSALSHSGLAPDRLEINVPEALLADSYEDVAAGIDRMRALGIGLAVDGFGSGRSALGSVRASHFRTIKIAPNVVRDAGDSDPHSIAVIRGTVAMAQSLGIDVLARGVETRAQFELMAMLGCRLIAGDVNGPALASAEIADKPNEAANRAAA